MSTTLPHGIIQINEGNIAWYGDITANWQLIDSKIGEYDAAIASIPAPANNGTLTINYGGTTIAMFGADDASNVTADIPAPGDGTITVTYGGSTLGTFTTNQANAGTIDIPAPGDGTLTIQLNGADVQTFTANASTNATANIQCVDLTSAQTIGGDKDFTGTTGTCDVIPATTDTYDLGSSTKEYNNAYAKTVVTGGITLDNKAIDTDANGNMTYNSHIVDTIEEQGEEYIRYSNGLQVCFKRYAAKASTATLITLPKPFIDTNYNSSVTDYSGVGPKCSISSVDTITETGFSIRNIYDFDLYVDVISIGKWK